MKKLIFVPVLILCSSLILINNVFAKKLNNIPLVAGYKGWHSGTSTHPHSNWMQVNGYVAAREGVVSRNYMNKLAGWINEERNVMTEQQEEVEKLNEEVEKLRAELKKTKEDIKVIKDYLTFVFRLDSGLEYTLEDIETLNKGECDSKSE